MKTLVMKFGGTSTGNVNALNRAADIVAAQYGQWDRIVVVVSAMEGVTDMLIDCAEQSIAGDKDHYQVIINALWNKINAVVWPIFAGDHVYEQLMELIDARIQELTSICQRIQLQGKSSPRDIDEIAAIGERINVHVFSALLCNRGVHSQAIEATNLIVTDDCYQAASPIQNETDARVDAVLSPLFAEAIIPVVTGFIGATPDGTTTTLGRGGSDYTAAILGKSLHADEVWIWTDVDGVMTADPGLTPGARLIPEISYSEVYELAYFGAKVIHPKTILAAWEANLPLWVINTFNPQCKGTKIGNCSLTNNCEVTAVTGLFDICLLSVRIMSVKDLTTSRNEIIESFSKLDINPLAVFRDTHERSINFVFSEKSLNHAIHVLEQDSSLRLLGIPFSRFQVTDNIALITAVGREIYIAPQVLQKISVVLEKAGVGMKIIRASPDSLVFSVANKDGEHAIKHIHDKVILNDPVISPITHPVLKHLSAI
ncbi:aspartate kinase [Chloroflexota bacterium]